MSALNVVLTLNINYNGTQLDNFFSPTTFAVQKVEIESHTLVDLAASWQLTGELQLVARLSNLFDKDYEEILGFVRPGRGVFAGIRGRFQK